MEGVQVKIDMQMFQKNRKEKDWGTDAIVYLKYDVDVVFCCENHDSSHYRC